jgi:hypothetical protein
MVIEHCGRKDCEMTGDLGPKILFGRMNIYSFLILFDTFYFVHFISTTFRKQFLLIAYIAKYIKNQKGKPSNVDLPLLKYDITTFPRSQKSGIMPYAG